MRRLDESDIGQIHLDQKAEITADSFPRKRFAGKVDRIATKGVSVSNVVTFEVRIELTSENRSLLKPLMTSNVTIVVSDKPDVLQIPANAVARKRDGEFVTLKSEDDPAGKLAKSRNRHHRRRADRNYQWAQRRRRGHRPESRG